MGQTFFEQLNISPEKPKSEIELTMEEADVLLREIRLHTAKLLERVRELEITINSFGGEAALMEKYQELKHAASWWQEFNEDIENRNFESITVKSV